MDYQVVPKGHPHDDRDPRIRHLDRNRKVARKTTMKRLGRNL